ncbi:HAD family phosphatase [Roseomonas frigidaquae]|uniref:HAD family phosphatase n=1 Tax=Falsiroseomonas frigidaquae TaxID=487318 RepID=A0ABX1EW39_9PROT|nr:HAD family phosphatase [Falsiroseomonas frigidaquae]NKE43760.1 HAD family phosphatase [Falsiroseomonas frigidaquae]
MPAVSRLCHAVIFDMDGLLFDSEVLYREAILAAARELGHAFTAADFPELVGRSWALNRVTLQRHVGPEGDVEAFRLAWVRHYDGMRADLALKPGVVALLDRLDALRLPRAICTSSSHADVAHNLALHGLAGRFDAVVAAGDYARGKPAPDPFLRAAEVLGVAPEICLALEDSHNGVRAAAAAGMRTVMVPDLLPPTDELRALCHLVATDLHDVCALLG